MTIHPDSPLAKILKARAANRTTTTDPVLPQTTAESCAPKTQVTEIPYRLKRLEPTEPAEIINDDPVFDSVDAAAYLGVSAGRLAKWRQRDQGPDFLRYPGNYIRYELSALVQFRATYRVRPSSQANPGRR